MSYIKSYIDYIRKENEEVKTFHSILIASIFTGFFIVIYLFLVRDISPPAPDINISNEREYSNTETNNITDQDSNISTGTEQDFNPIDSFKSVWNKALKDFQDTKNSIGQSEYTNSK